MRPDPTGPGAPSVDGPRLLARLDELAAIGATPAGGVTREAYGPLDVAARDLVGGWMAEAGLEVTVDAATNLVGRRPGSTDRWVGTGSHLDTVVDAGPLDGAYGVVAAVEAAAALRHTGLRHGLVVVGFANEEGARGTDGMAGSRALVGEVDAAELDALDDEGVTLASRLDAAGGDPLALAGARWDLDTIAAFVELHIEQGPVLDADGADIGVVLGITGRQTVDIALHGQANHAGTTPMELRHDALAAAAEVVLAVEELALRRSVRVATVGHVSVTPNVRNVVPGTALVSAELRDHDPDRMTAGLAAISHQVQAIADRRGVTATVTAGQTVVPVRSDEAVLAAVRRVAGRTGRPVREMWSGAGHDAQILGRHVPMAMVFVPSRDGISHAPTETTEPEHLVAGAQVLADALVELGGP